MTVWKSRIVLLALPIVVAIGFAGTVVRAGWFTTVHEVSYSYIAPPNDLLPGVRRIAVMDLEGPMGKNAADGIISRILSTSEWLQGQAWTPEATPTYFDVVERSRLSQVMQEQKLSASGLVDGTGAAQIGQILGVDALIVGTTQQISDDTSELREVTKQTKEGVSYTVNVRFHTRMVRLTGSIRIIDPNSGRILLKYDRNEEASQTEVDPAKLEGYNVMLSRCANAMGGPLVSGILPGSRSASVALIRVKQHKKDSKALNELASQHRLEDAWAGYRAMYSKDEYNHEVIYNLGVLHEALGDYDEALKLFGTARKINKKEGDYPKAVSRVEWLKSNRARLEELGYILSRRFFSEAVAKEAETSATTPHVIVKKKSASLFAEASDSSRILARLPKNMELEMLGHKKVGRRTFYKVKTIKDEVGWLSDKEAKRVR